ncbi:AAA family ATPase [Natranaerofaba carboxydovora]|uniref:ATP-binding protein n=1 Tax=Natranaerofaba carboxydovora TaxID=2742683 RepID=UPI001F138A3E|nr:AAA family ATPase [Natranaerofaba carboxydovora]UMZ73193.1 Septum site-determining protein MinD [Natranaerofaba carboxydovora]
MPPKKIAVAGKGGTGKTTFASLLIRYLAEKKKGTILGVDADPNANLNEALGEEAENTIGDILNSTKERDAVPQGMTKERFIEFRLMEALIETDNVDLIVMGNPEGPGCYCYPNDLLRKHLEDMEKNYDYVVIDNEAGLEHLSRKTISDVDVLFVISDSSARGIRSAARVKEIVEGVDMNVDQMYLLVTRTDFEDMDEILKEEIDKTGIELIGNIPYDKKVVEFDLRGKPLFDLPSDSVSVTSTWKILDRLNL